MHLLKQLWVRLMRRARDEYEDTQEDIVHCSWRTRLLLAAALFYLVGATGLGIYWSFTPAAINVAGAIHTNATVANAAQLKGVATTSALIAITETLLDKPGGYLANDMLPPSVFLDDMPNWELGVLTQVRDTTQVLRASFSQSMFNQPVDVDLQRAEVRFNFSEHSWIFPATESQYREGVVYLKKYNARLQQGEAADAHFYSDAQHLSDYLAGVEKRLKNMSQRLTASIGPSVNTDVSAMQATQSIGGQAANGLYTKTPWYKIDDVFYEARGTSWAMISILQGVELDFSDVLQQKNVKSSFDQILRELAPTQETIYSPIILNGSGFGVVANHSLTLASYLARAQAAVADCRRQLLVVSP